MSTAYIDGFVKRAQDAGLSKEQAMSFLKSAMDPASLANAGGGDPSQGGGIPGGGAGGPPPGADPSQGQPPQSNGGIPPEIEQMIQQLPPEVLQQLVQEIEAELGQGGQGGDPSQAGAGGPPPGADPSQGGGDPSQGGMMPPKQGSEKLLAKEAKYVEGFIERALNYGFDKNAAKEMYKKALEIMEGSAPSKPAVAPVKEKNAHFEGFLSQAQARGISQDEAVQAYNRVFGK